MSDSEAAGRTSILMVHRVCPRRTVAFGLPDAWRVRGTALSFAELLAWIGERPVRALAEVVAALEAGEEPPPGVVLTFDDGYAEWVEIGRQLAARGWPAVFFWSRAMSASGRLHPVDEYYDLLDRATRSRFEIELPNGARVRGALDGVASKRALVTGGPKPFVVDPNTAHATLDAVSEAVGASRRSGGARELYLSEAGARALESLGHEIGAHGLAHVRLTTLSDVGLDEEVRGSRRWLGGATRWFAYPDGDHDARVAEAVRAAGYRAALTCESGDVRGTHDVVRLPRQFCRPAAD